MTTATPAAINVPRRQRINLRVLLFAAVVLALPAFIVYQYIDFAAVEQEGDLLKVDLKAMSSFPLDPSSGTIDDVPKQWRALDGKRVVLYGEMWCPSTAADAVDQFDLVYSIAKCCLSGPPLMQHFVHSVAIKGKVGRYQGLCRVVGTLSVKVTKTDGKIDGVYWLDVEETRPLR
jgi:hypothetical protein